MKDKPKVYPDHASHGAFIEYKYVDGPHKGRVAFSIPKGKFKKVGYDAINRIFVGDTSVVFDGFELLEENPTPPKPKNTIEVKASCGQKMTLELHNIDEGQNISEVTIRGVTYTPK